MLWTVFVYVLVVVPVDAKVEKENEDESHKHIPRILSDMSCEEHWDFQLNSSL